jgi:hypothetical protein
MFSRRVVASCLLALACVSLTTAPASGRKLNEWDAWPTTPRCPGVYLRSVFAHCQVCQYSCAATDRFTSHYCMTCCCSLLLQESLAGLIHSATLPAFLP